MLKLPYWTTRPATTLATVLLLAAAGPARAAACSERLASDVAAAGNARSAATRARADDVETRRAELDLARHGLTASIGARPSLGVGHDLATLDELDALDLIGYQVDAALGYRFDEVAIARARAALNTASARLAAQQRADVLEGLLALSRLRVAERAEAAAERELEAADAALMRAEQTALERAADPDHAPLPGTPAAGEEADAAPAFLREARLQARLAGLALRDARAATAVQVAALHDLGVPTPQPSTETCELEPLGAAAPRAAEHRGLAAAQEAVTLAQAQLNRAWWGPVRDLRLEAQFQEGGGRASASVAVAAGQPEAELALRLRPTGKDAWRVQLSANLRLDQGTGAAIARAEATLEAAAAELAGYEAGLALRLAHAQQAVERAWEEVTLLTEALLLAELRLRDPAEARNASRNAQAVGRALDARERGLQAYYRAYAAELAISEEGWPLPVAGGW